MSRILSDEQRINRNAYARRYRAKHPDKVRQWRINYAFNLTERMKAAAVEGGEVNE